MSLSVGFRGLCNLYAFIYKKRIRARFVSWREAVCDSVSASEYSPEDEEEPDRADDTMLAGVLDDEDTATA